MQQQQSNMIQPQMIGGMKKSMGKKPKDMASLPSAKKYPKSKASFKKSGKMKKPSMSQVQKSVKKTMGY